jgi:hypothetical protein
MTRDLYLVLGPLESEGSAVELLISCSRLDQHRVASHRYGGSYLGASSVSNILNSSSTTKQRRRFSFLPILHVRVAQPFLSPPSSRRRTGARSVSTWAPRIGSGRRPRLTLDVETRHERVGSSCEVEVGSRE